MLSRSVRARTAVAALVLLVLTALNVLALDHTAWHVGVDETHALHCHGEPASCSGSPVPSGPGQFLYTEPGWAVPDLIEAGPVALELVVAKGLPLRPEAPPPRV